MIRYADHHTDFRIKPWLQCVVVENDSFAVEGRHDIRGPALNYPNTAKISVTVKISKARVA
jgi:hypothetical protein